MGFMPTVGHRVSPARASTRSGQDSLLSPGEREVIAIFVQMTQTLGLPRSLGEIYGLLFATPRPLAHQDIVNRLKLSKGSVSQGLRFLRTIGAVQTRAAGEDRRERFEPVVELRALVGGFLRERVTPQLANWVTRTQALSLADFKTADTPPPPAADLKVLANRLDKLKTWQHRADTVLPLVGKFIG